MWGSALDAQTLASIGACGFSVGVLIGSTAIGGVLLAPMLVFLTGMETHAAVALALWCFLWSGLVGVRAFVRRGSIDWQSARWLCVAAAPAALAGTLVGAHVPIRLLQLMIGTLTAGAGANVLRPGGSSTTARPLPGKPALLLTGAAGGFLSAVIGAGGALIVTPILIALGAPALVAIGLGQVIQLPISAVASIAHVRAGEVDLALGLWLPVALALGIACGVPFAHRVPQGTLRRLLGAVMVVAGGMILLRCL